MPEGPEVKTVARTLSENLVGERLSELWHSEFTLRRAVNYAHLKLLKHKTITSVKSYGKVLFIHVDNQCAIMAQLGMTGQLVVEERDAPLLKHTHIRWQLENSNRELRYVDPRRFGCFDSCDELRAQQIIDKLGPDPFCITKLQEEQIIKNMRASSRAIKAVLLDQNIISGVGNIYASESLFLARINPLVRACDISYNSYVKLIASIKQVLNLAYKNSGTTFSNYVDGSGTKGKNLEFLLVFQRHAQPCVTCETPITRITQHGRSTFFCAVCQLL
jgi:formamidopyrimidine-DNA glycosylase